MPVSIPDTHRHLLTSAVPGLLATMLPDGQPQISVVRIDYDGAHVLINTTLERQQGGHMLANSKVALLVIDPRDDSRWIEVRGRVVELRQHEEGVTILIEPVKVSLDAIFR